MLVSCTTAKAKDIVAEWYLDCGIATVPAFQKALSYVARRHARPQDGCENSHVGGDVLLN